MVDFTSTQQGIDDQSARCARLVAAVIAQALRDLAIPINENERKHGMNLVANAYESLRFFYDENSPFKQYAAMVGIEAKPFIYNLETRDYDGQKVKHPFLKDRELRTIRRRLRWYKVLLAEMNNARPQ